MALEFFLSLPYCSVEYPVWDEAFLGVEILVEICPHDAVIVDHDAVLLQEKVDVGIKAFFATFTYEGREKSTISGVQWSFM